MPVVDDAIEEVVDGGVRTMPRTSGFMLCLSITCATFWFRSIHSAPRLLVEVPSPRNTRRDTEQKLKDYASIGVPEIWVFSTEPRSVEVLLLEGGHIAPRQSLPRVS